MKFEPGIDSVVTKIPRFAFEKFPQADPTLTTQMKSVGEATAIGRTFKERGAHAPRVSVLMPSSKPSSPDSVSEALTDARACACAPHCSLETRWPCASTRSGLGGDGKPWRIGTEIYGDRDILPRDVISRKLSVAASRQRAAILICQQNAAFSRKPLRCIGCFQNSSSELFSFPHRHPA